MPTRPGSCAAHTGLQPPPRVSPFRIPQEVQEGKVRPPFPIKISVVPKGGDPRLCSNGSREQLCPGNF